MKNFYQKGVTLVELLVVVVVLTIILSIVFSQLSKTRELQILKNAVNEVLSVLDQARSKTLASVDSSEYGVRFQSDQVIIFKGKVFSSGDPDNEATNIFSPAVISNVTLGGVSGESGSFYFNRLSGTPSEAGTVTISTSNYSKVVTISATGIVGSN